MNAVNRTGKFSTCKFTSAVRTNSIPVASPCKNHWSWLRALQRHSMCLCFLSKRCHCDVWIHSSYEKASVLDSIVHIPYRFHCRFSREGSQVGSRIALGLLKCTRTRESDLSLLTHFAWARGIHKVSHLNDLLNFFLTELASVILHVHVGKSSFACAHWSACQIIVTGGMWDKS